MKRLSSVWVLDPVCGTGNFLYVALRLMKQLEGEVLKGASDLEQPTACNLPSRGMCKRWDPS
ncbi:DNA methyltransferase [Bradyrhizobium sp. UFLA01-814]|uniref:DNA methyltransferase n=1 Tax=Bradyrhizobium sp. UFLA01-814 TaxID=3023480 RepID=UPI00398B7EB7